jgi:hypothetical protein
MRVSIVLLSAGAAAGIAYFAMEARDPYRLDDIVASHDKLFGFTPETLPVVGTGMLGDRFEAQYDERENRITFNDATPSLDILSSDTRSRRVLAHEFGHAYADLLSERLGRGDWPDLAHTFERYGWRKTLAVRMIGEGIAEYAADRISKKKRTPVIWPSDWPAPGTSLSDAYLQTLIYDGGYEIVRPIIDAYGSEGIRYLITHEPDAYEPCDLFAYQERALTALKNNNYFSLMMP